MKNSQHSKHPSINVVRGLIVSAAALCSSVALAATVPLQAGVPLQNATATFSQTLDGDYSVARAINGTTADDLGWAISPTPFTTEIPAQTAAFETISDVGFAGGSLLTFTLTQTVSNPGHLLGRFRLSVTTDDRSQFCDGLPTGGDVTANWVVLNPSSVTALNTTMFTVLSDQSILAGGSTPDTDVYTVTAPTTLTGITGIRLEALEDPSLPYGGPGRWPGNGNFVLSEFEVSIAPIPEPTTSAILAFGGLAWLARRRAR